ncbi:hypothetical protein Pmani_019580 [Petrolisthes manimaculis]|uniref:Uncharacterized protein n=1 Tax=Petrolisthes manimaculis TaxID=1843537 RepID=A0AAE1U783_9EUCA|nr:hypothetical protein Pmani_019580 [Petrolisthes manimaculis]
MEAQFDHVDNPLTTQNNIYHTDTTTGPPPPHTPAVCQASPAPPTTDTALLLQRLQDLSEQVRQLQHSAHPTRQPHQTQDRHLPPPFTPTRQQWASPTSVNQGRAQVGIDGGPGNSPETPHLTPRRLNTPPEAAASPPPTQDESCLVPDGFTTRTGRRIKRPCKLTYSISPISVATVSRPPRPRGIKASCPGDVGLTDTLAKEEATPAVDAITHTRRQNHTVPQLYHLTPPTCPYSHT